MGDVVAMSGKERARLVEMEQVVQGKATVAEVGRRLRLSGRQAKRVWRRYREEGAAGLVHRSRGRPSNRSQGAMVRAGCLAAYREWLEGYGPTLAAEKLSEVGLEVDHETLRRWLLAEGLWQRARKRGPHRAWRERKAHFGEMVQLDGSFHPWFGGEERPCLMNMVDDATGKTLGRMDEEETTAAAMRVLWGWIERHGIPRALYTDWKNVYLTTRAPTVEEQLAGEVPKTAFGTACAKLGIAIIGASSPQAKGRVERSNGVYQDRFVKELALRGITTIAGANELLEGEFCEGLNRKFARPPASEEDVHRTVPEGVDLAEIFVWEETRTVANDWTVRWHNRWYQITGPRGALPRAKGKIVVQERLDGSLHLLDRGRPLVFHTIEGPRPRPVPPKVVAPPKHAPVPPAPDHPWRRNFSRRAPRSEARSGARREAASIGVETR